MFELETDRKHVIRDCKESQVYITSSTWKAVRSFKVCTLMNLFLFNILCRSYVIPMNSEQQYGMALTSRT